MKKSTLITTIAMIVVVVVALSTATYAWFSSATTTSASDTITTQAAADWVIMGGTASHTGDVDDVTYSSSTAINLTMLDGLYSPTAVLNGTLASASNTATFNAQQFFTATQNGTGLASTAQAANLPTIDPLGDTDNGKVSAVNYVRIIRTSSASKKLKLTITVLAADTKDSDFYACNAFNTYVTWYTGGASGSANTSYYYGTVDGSATTGTGEGYYVATLVDANSPTTPDVKDPVAASNNVVYAQSIDHNNDLSRAGSQADPSTNYATATTDAPLRIGTETIESGRYYQITINIGAAAIAQNQSVNIAFYAWFDGWALDNTGSNSGATVYYEFGDAAD